MSDLELGRWDWLLLSIALATLASLVRWLIAHMASRARSGDSGSQGRAILVLNTLVDSPWVTQPLRLVYGVGLPAALLFWQRILTSRGLGLKPFPDFSLHAGAPSWAGGQWTEWAHDLGWGALVLAVAFLLVRLGDHVARARTPHPEPQSYHDIWLSLREAVYHQAHWAFYRDTFVITWGVATGSWLAALPIALEAVLSPMLWEGMQASDRSYARRVVLRGGLYVATTLVFLKTQNLWVALAVDTLLGWLLIPYPLVGAEKARAPVTEMALEGG